MDGDIILLILSTLAFVVGLAIVRWVHSHYHMEIRVTPEEPLPAPAPWVSVVVPARNEARNIRRCVEALLRQDIPSYEVIVVDDRSTDETAQILAEMVEQERAAEAAGLRPEGTGQVGSAGAAVEETGRRRLKVIQGREPPAGWAGKPHALTLGVAEAKAGAEASGGWLCFVDADTFAEPGLLRATVGKAQRLGADMFSIMTGQELGTFWEKVILPLVFTALSVGFSTRKVNDPQRPEAIANGQFILIRREVYAAVGGHRAVHDQIAEDKALAELVKRRGFRLLLGDGRELATTRMYTSFGEIWEGWTKNIYLGMRGRLGLLLVGALVALAGALALPLWLAAAFGWLAVEPGVIPAIVAVQAGLVAAYLLWMRALAAEAFGVSRLYAFTLPLGALVFAGMMAASTFRVLSGKGVRWKGRTYV